MIFNLPGGVHVSEVGEKRELEAGYTSDQVRALTEDFRGRHVYVDHLFGERL